jgi:NADH-quinone oxidoreductase subunit E
LHNKIQTEVTPLFTEDKMDYDKIDQIIKKYNHEPGSLIQILLEIQNELYWLPGEAFEMVSKELDVPLQQVRHAATFYKAFSLVPKGRHTIHVCVGTACHVRGAVRILDSIKEKTGIGPGETDPELNFTLETVNCLGCCALGPVAKTDDKLYGKMTPSKVINMLNDCK